MPTYLRKWRDRTILVRPTKWEGIEEVKAWDCIDFTDAIKKAHDDLEPIDFWLMALRNTIKKELLANYSQYRSKPFLRQHKDNPRLDNPFFGCCVVATEAILFLTHHYQITMGEQYAKKYSRDAPIVEPWRVKDMDGIWHHYIMTSYAADLPWQKNPYKMETDATEEQFSPSYWTLDNSYKNGKKTRLMGWKNSPSKRTLNLIGNILPSSSRYRNTDKTYANPDMPGSLEDFFSC